MGETLRILFLGNNWVGWQVARWLREREEEIVGLVVHPPHKRKYGEEIIGSLNLEPQKVFDGSLLHQPETLESIRTLRVDLALSILFDYILKQNFIQLFHAGVINLHPAYLPFNRGQYPNVWSIVEGTPSGVTLHYIDAGIDTGDIIAQKEVEVEPADTGESLYRKLEKECVALFQETWPLIETGKVTRVPQEKRAGTYHRVQDIDKIDEVKLDSTYTARDLINILRARTFPPYKGAYFIENGKRVYMRLRLSYEQDL